MARGKSLCTTCGERLRRRTVDNEIELYCPPCEREAKRAALLFKLCPPSCVRCGNPQRALFEKRTYPPMAALCTECRSELASIRARKG